MEQETRRIEEALTFDDVSLCPQRSDVIPKDVEVSTRLTRNVRINIPIVSAAMDTVTESRLAIALAREGGIGIIHRAMELERQVAEIDKVKKSEYGMVVDPITMSPDQRLYEVLEVMEKYRISGVPVTKNGKLVGILTNRDLRFETKLDLKVGDVMTKERLVTAPVGTSLEEAKEILHRHRIEKLPVVDRDFNLRGLITIKDIEKRIKYPNACKDVLGRLRVGAAVGAGPEALERVPMLIKAGADVLVVDTAHGHSEAVLDMVRSIKRRYSGTEVVAGNIVTPEAAEDLIKAGADAIKVGVGPGSICTTRVVAGVGVPQISAILACAAMANRHDVPVISDGGIKHSGDITKAIAAGAHSVMLGGLFAGTEESPGETVLYQGRTYKVYRGMGSLGAMQSRAGRERYFQDPEADLDKMVPEGIEGRVPYKGSLAALVYQLVGGLRAGMGYCGCRNIAELRTKARFLRLTQAGLRESHVHDVIITKEAPNYRPGKLRGDERRATSHGGVGSGCSASRGEGGRRTGRGKWRWRVNREAANLLKKGRRRTSIRATRGLAEGGRPPRQRILWTRRIHSGGSDAARDAVRCFEHRGRPGPRNSEGTSAPLHPCERAGVRSREHRHNRSPARPDPD